MHEKVTYHIFLREAKKPASSPYTYIYYPITYPLSYALFKLGFTANGISVLSVLTSILGAYVIFREYLVTGIALFLLSYLFDFCDGNVARIHYKYLGLSRTEDSKKRGALLENFYANISYFLFFISLGYYFTLTQASIIYFIAGALAIGSKLIKRYTALHICFINRTPGLSFGHEERAGGKPFYQKGLMSHIKYFFTRVFDSARMYYLSFLIVAILFKPILPLFFIAYALLVILLSITKIVLTFWRVEA